MADPERVKRDYSQYQIYEYLQHYKNEKGEEYIVFPITTAQSVIGMPVVVKDVDDLKLSDIGFLETDTVEVSESDMNYFLNKLVFH